jgi:antirestriction protein
MAERETAEKTTAKGTGVAGARGDGTPRVYAASISDYVAGRLHGVWVDATDAQAAGEAIAAMLKASREPHAEEWAVHDYEGFGSYRFDDFTCDLELACALGAAIQEHGTVFADYLGHVGAPQAADDVAAAVERFQESYQGEYDSLEEWAEQFLDDTGVLKDSTGSSRRGLTGGRARAGR